MINEQKGRIGSDAGLKHVTDSTKVDPRNHISSLRASQQKGASGKGHSLQSLPESAADFNHGVCLEGDSTTDGTNTNTPEVNGLFTNSI